MARIDPSYGKNGRVRIGGVGTGTPRFADDGSFYVSVPQPDDSLAVLRYNPKGHPDTAFDTNAAQAAGGFAGVPVVIPTGGLLLSTGSLTQVVLHRLDASGQTDPSFGNGGTLLLNLPDSVAELNLLRVEPNGQILAYIFENPATTVPSKFLNKILGFTATGKVDPTFGTNGQTTIGIDAQDMTIASDGTIVLAGSARRTDLHLFGETGGSNLAVERLGANGQVDTGFGDAGIRQLQFNSDSSGESVALSPRGRIVVAGDIDSFGSSVDQPMLVELATNDEHANDSHEKIRLSGTTLSISGTDAHDEINIRDNVTDRSEIRITVNDRTRLFSKSAVNEIDIDARAGDDYVNISSALVIPCSIIGGDGSDLIFGGGGRDTIDGGRGEDRIYGNGGSDVIRGGSGIDEIFGDAGNDRIYGGGDADSVSGGNGNDRLFMHDETEDSIYGGAGNDTTIADNNQDFISGVENQLS